jgi:amidase
VLDNLERTVERLTDEGAVVDEVSLPKSFPKISSTLTTILTVETATYHRDAYATKRDLYGARIGALVQEGARVPGVDYVAARQLRPSLVADLEHCLDGFDTLLTPTAPAVAPRNPTVTTGDASFLAPFSFAGLPAISLPTGVNHWGLPFGVQLVGRRWADFDLLAVAAWCEARIAFSARPPLW